MSETNVIARMQAAIDEFGKAYKERGESAPDKLEYATFMAISKFLPSAPDKLFIAALAHSLILDEKEKNLAFNWAKEILDGNKGNPNIFASVNESPLLFHQKLEFFYKIAPEMAQNFINSNTVEYINSQPLMAAIGLKIPLKPGKEPLEAALLKLPASELTLDMLDVAETPSVKAHIKEGLMNSPVYARKFFHDEIRLRNNGKPYNQDIIDRTFVVGTGLNPQETHPVSAGALKISVYDLKSMATQAYGEPMTQDFFIRAAGRDPLFGMRIAAKNYPVDPLAMKMYQAALPRGNELFHTKEHGAVIVDLLNALEPSQYAGQSHKLIPEKDIFKILDGVKSEQLYDLIVEQQTPLAFSMNQGVYNEVSKRLYDTLKRDGKTLTDLINSSPERAEKLMTFVTTADAYRRMDGFIRATTPEDHMMMAQKLLEKGEEGYKLSTLSVFIEHLPKGSPALAYIESEIISKALTGTAHEKIDIGLLAGWYANQKTHIISPDNRTFFDKIKNDPNFNVPPLNSIKSSALLDPRGRNFQLHTFYNDKDGVDTFNSFSSSLRADGYKLKKEEDFLIFTKEQNGRKIEILVSPPEKNGETIPKILEYAKEQGGVISVLSGRGHAHHMSTAVELITNDTKIVSLGGCWGHNYTSAVLEKSPDAHILATTGVGRMVINNFNTKWLNDQILSGRDVNWTSLKTGWENLKKDRTIAEDMRQYVAPQDNIFLLYERRRNELIERLGNDNDAQSLTSELNRTFSQATQGRMPTSPPSAAQERPAITSQIKVEREPSLTA